MSKVKRTGDFESLEVTDGKVKIHQREPIKPKDNFYIDELPWTEKQKRFIELSLDKNTRLILCKGPAGSSKTLTAVYSALQLLNNSKVSDVIYMRSAVESSDSRLGFLPGDADEKLHYYNLPFMDKLDELLNEEIEHKIIADNTGGLLMQRGMVDMCIVGTDRVSENGDVANKIGTYLKALAAKDNNIPFYVALPSTTYDKKILKGKDIPIEERSSDELSKIDGIDEDGKIKKVQIYPNKSKALNLAFDVTPAKYITGLITEKGICEASEKGLKNLFK